MESASIFHVLFGCCPSISYASTILLYKFIWIALSFIFTEDTHTLSVNYYFYGILVFIFIKSNYKKTWTSNHFNANGSVGQFFTLSFK